VDPGGAFRILKGVIAGLMAVMQIMLVRVAIGQFTVNM